MIMREKPVSTMERLNWLRLKFMLENYRGMADEAGKKNLSHQEYFENLVQGETDLRWDNSINRRITMARFPVIKTLEQFQWNWPRKINRSQIQQLCRLNFINQKANIIFLGGVGMGKTHLASAIGYCIGSAGIGILPHLS